METPSYIAKNIEELFDQSAEVIQDLIANGEVDQTTLTLGNNYKIPVNKQSALSDVITYILIGALQPDDVVQALQDLCDVDSAQALHIAEDLEHSILEKARISLFKKQDKEHFSKIRNVANVFQSEADYFKAETKEEPVVDKQSPTMDFSSSTEEVSI
jgi:hypothetical protein